LLGDDEDPEIVAIARKAFFSSATYLMGRINDIARSKDHEAGKKLMKDVNVELREFAKEIEEEAANTGQPRIISIFHPSAREVIGILPNFLDASDPRPAAKQFNDAYQHGGGWRPIEGFEVDWNGDGCLRYPGDPPLKPVAGMRHHKEAVMFYEHALVAVIQPDGSFEVARMD
jgi:hypothetical protein